MLFFLIASVLCHVTFFPRSTAPGYYTGVLRVPHGCNTTSTISVTLQIPANVTGVKPRAVPGWTISTATRPLPVPRITEAGTQVTTTVDTVTWSNGNLPDDYFEELGLMFSIPVGSDVYYFPVKQTCVAGIVNWADVPAPGASAKYPAPSISIVAASPSATATALSKNSAVANFQLFGLAIVLLMLQ